MMTIISITIIASITCVIVISNSAMSEGWRSLALVQMRPFVALAITAQHSNCQYCWGISCKWRRNRRFDELMSYLRSVKPFNISSSLQWCDIYATGRHNLWGYRWAQEILKSYPKARNNKFSRQKCHNCAFSRQKWGFYSIIIAILLLIAILLY